MSDKKQRILYLVYGIIQSVLTVACGVCLIMAGLAIYDGGNGAYSREAVATQFEKILIPVLLCLTGVVAGIVLSFVFPRKAQKPKGQMAPADAIRRLSLRIDPAACPAELTAARKKEQTLRLVLRLMAAAVCIAVAIPALVYLFDLTNFDNIAEGLTEDIVAAMTLVLPASAVGLSAWVVVTLACHYSLKRELGIVKEALKVAPAQNAEVASSAKKSGHAVWIIRLAVLAVAIVFIILGIVNGGMNDVLQKAIRICTECIGLG